MGKKDKKTFDGSGFSVWQIMDSANAYYELSRAVFGGRLPTTHKHLPERLDLIAPCATNRILALELYLKATLIACKTRVPQTHDLKDLFDALHEKMHDQIKTHFDRRVKETARGDVPDEMSIYFSPWNTQMETSDLDEADRRGVRSDATLTGLLVRNRHGFVASRYLFQEIKPGKVSTFSYEFKRLAILCSVLCEGLENVLSDKQPGYKRHFHFLGNEDGWD